MRNDQIGNLSATSLTKRVEARDISALEATEACIERIEELDGELRSFISVHQDQARRTARQLDGAKQPMGPLHGVPIAVKDLNDVRNMITTQGSLLSDRHPANEDDVSIARLRAAGAVILGKTNTPEFGFGAVCTNKLCGPTANPWDTTLTSGGSSGGSAVAVATGMASLAHGTDFGGSVRIPASFTGCIGYRPTPGRIPEPKRALAWDTLATQGVLTRTVEDASLMATVMSGTDRRDPQSFVPKASHEESGTLRVAASSTMNGAYRIDPNVRSFFAGSVDAAQGVFGEIKDATPDVEGASDAFKALRAAQSWMNFGGMVEDQADQLTESFVWNVRKGKAISAEEYLRAQATRSRTYRSFQEFFGYYDILMLPAASVMPFPNDQGEVTEIDGEPTGSIIDYLACTYLISLVGFPSIVLPAPEGISDLPFGIQLVARPHADEMLLNAARRLEASGFRHRFPPMVTPGTPHLSQ